MADRDLTRGSVAGHLAKLGLPMVLGIVGVLSVSLADAYFLGRLGTGELAAISYTFPVVLTLSSVGIGLSAGAASVASRAIGAGRTEDAKRRATDALILAFLLVLLLAGLGLLLVRPLFSLLGAEGETLASVVRYMRVWFFGLPFLVVPMVANGLIRANGDAVAPSAIMVAGALVNIGLDPVLIFGLGPFPRLEVEGAAWATLASRAVTFAAALGVLALREKLLTLARPPLSKLTESWREVLKVGGPAALSTSINPLAITVVTGFLSSYGDEAVAAFGVATRIESLASVPMLALSSAIGPVAGQNWGGGQRGRARTAMRDAYLFSAFWAAVIIAGFVLFGEEIAGLFTDDEAVARTVRLYLVIVGATLAGYGVVVNASAAFNATGRALRGLWYTALRSAALYVPAAGLAAVIGPVWAVFAAIAGVNVASGAFVAWSSLRRAEGDES
jgi:putative MATE family efflux protein